MHQEITMYDELMRRLDHVTLKLREYKTKNQELEARLRAAEDRDRPAASPPPPAPLPIFNVVVDKESIPPFRGDTPAAQPLVATRKFLHDPERVQDDHHTGTTRFLSTARGIVYQGVRDYPDVVGNPEPLLKRLFLQGLPLWLREYLAIIDELPLDRLVETAQRIWNTRTGVARTEPLADRHPPRPLRAVAPVEEPPEHRRTRWCSYHRTSRHDNTECRYRPRRLACFRCQQEGHLVKDCPFPPPSDGSAPVAGGTRWASPCNTRGPVTREPSPAIPSTPTCSPRQGRPMVRLMISGKMINAFIDTGSEATLLKHSAQTLIAPSRTSEPRRRLQGASGIACNHRLDFRLGYDSRTNNSYLRLRGKAFTVRYVNKDSLELTAVVMKMKGPRWQGPAKVVKKLGPVNYVVQDLSPPFSERNCHANQLRPFKLEEELTFPDASPYHDPDYVDPWLPDDAEPDHSNTSTSCGLSSETDVARTTNHTWNYRVPRTTASVVSWPEIPLLFFRVPLDLSAQHSQQPPFDVMAASLRSAHARRPVGLAREAL
ncbi:hypothetical protein C7M84_011874 [Penaeus vannamei]|uniref:CCHC-type domain-containing protein n=1 Tax=Penaeus vannamei TaxID=6689 RepID=A0A3R7QK11_PENVA|nr:hypothetical protein C7M84_011874 [Penaeus vannamei]